MRGSLLIVYEDGVRRRMDGEDVLLGWPVTFFTIKKMC